jgi:multimeric flavodoxin WrbA
MAARKIIIVEGSPRPSGNSTLLARAVASGARSLGAEVETLHLHKMDIRPCTACDACQESLEKDCIIDDAMKDAYPRLRAADAIVYASPIYWFTVSGQIKLFMDRCYALTFLGTLPGIDGSEPVEVVQTDLGGKKFGVVLSYGDVDPFTSGAVNAIRTFQDMARFVGSEMTGLVYGSALAAGEVAGNKALMNQAYDLGRALATDVR